MFRATYGWVYSRVLLFFRLSRQVYFAIFRDDKKVYRFKIKIDVISFFLAVSKLLWNYRKHFLLKYPMKSRGKVLHCGKQVINLRSLYDRCITTHPITSNHGYLRSYIHNKGYATCSHVGSSFPRIV